VIGAEDVQFVEKTISQKKATPSKETKHDVPATEPTQKKVVESAREKIFASPRARKLAGARGVDLAMVAPTGGNGVRIVEADVEAFLLEQPGSPAPSLPVANISKTIPMKGIRGLIAERMAASSQTAARVTLFMDVDATAFSTLREKLKTEKEKDWGFKPGYNDLLAKMCAIALERFPYMNARINGNEIEYIAGIHIGIAVDAERGLYVPVISDTNKKSLQAIGEEFRQRVEEIRSGKVLPETLSGGTFTITNLGMYDVDGFTPIINLPEAAILGVGRMEDRAVVREGKILVRKMMVLSLAFDPRLVDGAPAANFLQTVKDMIEAPDGLKLT